MEEQGPSHLRDRGLHPNDGTAIWLLAEETRPQHSTDDVSKQGKNQWRAIVQQKYT